MSYLPLLGIIYRINVIHGNIQFHIPTLYQGHLLVSFAGALDVVNCSMVCFIVMIKELK